MSITGTIGRGIALRRLRHSLSGSSTQQQHPRFVSHHQNNRDSSGTSRKTSSAVHAKEESASTSNDVWGSIVSSSQAAMNTSASSGEGLFNDTLESHIAEVWSSFSERKRQWEQALLDLSEARYASSVTNTGEVPPALLSTTMRTLLRSCVVGEAPVSTLLAPASHDLFVSSSSEALRALIQKNMEILFVEKCPKWAKINAAGAKMMKTLDQKVPRDSRLDAMMHCYESSTRSSMSTSIPERMRDELFLTKVCSEIKSCLFYAAILMASARESSPGNFGIEGSSAVQNQVRCLLPAYATLISTTVMIRSAKNQLGSLGKQLKTSSHEQISETLHSLEMKCAAMVLVCSVAVGRHHYQYAPAMVLIDHAIPWVAVFFSDCASINRRHRSAESGTVGSKPILLSASISLLTAAISDSMWYCARLDHSIRPVHFPGNRFQFLVRNLRLCLEEMGGTENSQGSIMKLFENELEAVSSFLLEVSQETPTKNNSANGSSTSKQNVTDCSKEETSLPRLIGRVAAFAATSRWESAMILLQEVVRAKSTNSSPLLAHPKSENEEADNPSIFFPKCVTVPLLTQLASQGKWELATDMLIYGAVGRVKLGSCSSGEAQCFKEAKMMSPIPSVVRLAAEQDRFSDEVLLWRVAEPVSVVNAVVGAILDHSSVKRIPSHVITRLTLRPLANQNAPLDLAKIRGLNFERLFDGRSRSFGAMWGAPAARDSNIAEKATLALLSSGSWISALHVLGVESGKASRSLLQKTLRVVNPVAVRNELLQKYQKALGGFKHSEIVTHIPQGNISVDQHSYLSSALPKRFEYVKKTRADSTTSDSIVSFDGENKILSSEAEAVSRLSKVASELQKGDWSCALAILSDPRRVSPILEPVEWASTATQAMRLSQEVGKWSAVLSIFTVLDKKVGDKVPGSAVLTLSSAVRTAGHWFCALEVLERLCLVKPDNNIKDRTSKSSMPSSVFHSKLTVSSLARLQNKVLVNVVQTLNNAGKWAGVLKMISMMGLEDILDLNTSLAASNAPVVKTSTRLSQHMLSELLLPGSNPHDLLRVLMASLQRMPRKMEIKLPSSQRRGFYDVVPFWICASNALLRQADKVDKSTGGSSKLQKGRSSARDFILPNLLQVVASKDPVKVVPLLNTLRQKNPTVFENYPGSIETQVARSLVATGRWDVCLQVMHDANKAWVETRHTKKPGPFDKFEFATILACMSNASLSQVSERIFWDVCCCALRDYVNRLGAKMSKKQNRHLMGLFVGLLESLIHTSKNFGYTQDVLIPILETLAGFRPPTTPASVPSCPEDPPGTSPSTLNSTPPSQSELHVSWPVIRAVTQYLASLYAITGTAPASNDEREAVEGRHVSTFLQKQFKWPGSKKTIMTSNDAIIFEEAYAFREVVACCVSKSLQLPRESVSVSPQGNVKAARIIFRVSFREFSRIAKNTNFGVPLKIVCHLLLRISVRFVDMVNGSDVSPGSEKVDELLLIYPGDEVYINLSRMGAIVDTTMPLLNEYQGTGGGDDTLLFSDNKTSILPLLDTSKKTSSGTSTLSIGSSYISASSPPIMQKKKDQYVASKVVSKGPTPLSINEDYYIPALLGCMWGEKKSLKVASSSVLPPRELEYVVVYCPFGFSPKLLLSSLAVRRSQLLSASGTKNQKQSNSWISGLPRSMKTLFHLPGGASGLVVLQRADIPRKAFLSAPERSSFQIDREALSAKPIGDAKKERSAMSTSGSDLELLWGGSYLEVVFVTSRLPTSLVMTMKKIDETSFAATYNVQVVETMFCSLPSSSSNDEAGSVINEVAVCSATICVRDNLSLNSGLECFSRDMQLEGWQLFTGNGDDYEEFNGFVVKTVVLRYHSKRSSVGEEEGGHWKVTKQHYNCEIPSTFKTLVQYLHECAVEIESPVIDSSKKDLSLVQDDGDDGKADSDAAGSSHRVSDDAVGVSEEAVGTPVSHPLTPKEANRGHDEGPRTQSESDEVVDFI